MGLIRRRAKLLTDSQKKTFALGRRPREKSTKEPRKQSSSAIPVVKSAKRPAVVADLPTSNERDSKVTRRENADVAAVGRVMKRQAALHRVVLEEANKQQVSNQHLRQDLADQQRYVAKTQAEAQTAKEASQAASRALDVQQQTQQAAVENMRKAIPAMVDYYNGCRRGVGLPPVQYPPGQAPWDNLAADPAYRSGLEAGVWVAYPVLHLAVPGG